MYRAVSRNPKSTILASTQRLHWQIQILPINIVLWVLYLVSFLWLGLWLGKYCIMTSPVYVYGATVEKINEDVSTWQHGLGH